MTEPKADFWRLSVLSNTEQPDVLLHVKDLYFSRRELAEAFAVKWGKRVMDQDEWRSDCGRLLLMLRAREFNDDLASNELTAHQDTTAEEVAAVRKRIEDDATAATG